MRIPKKLNINGETIKIKFSDKECKANGVTGLTKYGRNEMVLCRKIYKEPLHKDYLSKTFLHESVHFILEKGGYLKETTNDKLVSCISNGFMEIIKQTK